jgi:hypothetical protein
VKGAGLFVLERIAELCVAHKTEMTMLFFMPMKLYFEFLSAVAKALEPRPPTVILSE